MTWSEVAASPRLAISVEFLHGTYRADSSGKANTGRMTRGEWPPAPARLFAALVASDGTGGNCRVTRGSEQRELRWLEAQRPPVIRADAPDVCLHIVLQPRYVVESQSSSTPNVHHEFVGRKGALVRPGVRAAPRRPFVTYMWDAAPSADLLDALRVRCARVGYLGTADSPVRVRVGTDVLEDSVADAYIPSEDGNVAIRVPVTGHLDVLDRMYEEWGKRGPSVSRAQYPALNSAVWYRAPGHTVRNSTGRVVAWLRIGSTGSGHRWRSAAISGRRVSSVTASFKAAVLRQYDELFGEPPPVLHGHGFREKGYELARFLALPDVGFECSRVRIHGLGLWMPASSTRLEMARARDAVLAIRRLTGPSIDVRVTNHDGERRPWAANPKRWETKCVRWATAFPAVHERHGRLDLAEVSRWCRHAGLPDPIAFRSARKPLVHGAVDLSPVEVNRSGRAMMPYSHVELLFAEPVPGPVAIGSGRQRGFGLCVPVEDGEV